MAQGVELLRVGASDEMIRRPSCIDVRVRAILACLSSERCRGRLGLHGIPDPPAVGRGRLWRPVYGTPPLVWALHAWLVEHRTNENGYRNVLRMLADAGADVKPKWLDDERLRADRDLHAALSARVTVT